jgi:hypothetical protein
MAVFFITSFRLLLLHECNTSAPDHLVFGVRSVESLRVHGYCSRNTSMKHSVSTLDLHRLRRQQCRETTISQSMCHMHASYLCAHSCTHSTLINAPTTSFLPVPHSCFLHSPWNTRRSFSLAKMEHDVPSLSLPIMTTRQKKTKTEISCTCNIYNLYYG